MPDVVMPRLSDSMEEGTILRWLKASGDEVSRGEEIVEIETDKANMTYEADASGVLEIVASEGSTLPIGAPIASIGGGSSSSSGSSSGEGSSAGRAGPDAGSVSGRQAAETADPATTGSAGGAAARSASEGSGESGATATEPSPSMPAVDDAASGNGRIKASPVARRLARQLGVDLGSVVGSGPGGRIVKADVEAAQAGAPASAPAAATAAPAGDGAPAPASTPAAVPGPVVSGEGGSGRGEARSVQLSRLQQTVARRMAETKATVPEFTISTDVDMAAAVALRGQLKAIAAEGASAPSFNDLVVKACAVALAEFPRANGSYKDGAFELYERVNVGVAVAAQDALVVPTVFDADKKSLGQISRDARALAARVRAGQITPPELSGSTFTVSNLGMFGVTEFTAIINAGQAAILAVGALRDVPVVRDGEVVPGKLMSLTLACDHRILYGADAAQFLARIRALLEQPLALAL